ncbi:MAG: alpha/beta fold hydrolase, partial [Pseudonocardiaceae bacterium]
LIPETSMLSRVPPLAAFYRERFLASSLASMEGMAEAITSEPDRVAELAKTEMPVLVCHGEHDNGWEPQQQAEMAQRLGADYAVIPGARHSPAVEQTELTLKALLEFWRGSVVNR